MPLPVIPGVFRVALNHAPGEALFGFTNVIHVFSSTLTPLQVLTAINGALVAGMFDAKAAAMLGMTAVATKLDGAAPTAELVFTGTAFLGTGAGELVPAAAAVITLRTGQRGKRHTGRVFIGALSEDKMANGSVTPASLATMQAAWDTFITNATGAGVPLHVTSYGHDGAPPPPRPTRPAFAATTVAVTAAEAKSILGTQRRRQQKLRG